MIDQKRTFRFHHDTESGFVRRFVGGCRNATWFGLMAFSMLTLFAVNHAAAQADVSSAQVLKKPLSQRGTQAADPGLLFPNSDFESGDLTNWTATGTAFDFQPTKGDNPTARRRKQPAKHQGSYWIGTYEKYQGLTGQKPGQIQGDKPTGTLTSIPFQVEHGKIHFRIGGGRKADSVYVALVIDGREVIKTRGNNKETMMPQTWDVGEYMGKTAQIRIVDRSDAGWGHINADDFRFDAIGTPNSTSAAVEDKPKRGPLFDNSDFENGDLTNWSASGSAFDFQPTKGDNPTARRRKQPSRHQGQFWIGTYERYQGKSSQKPGQRQGDQPIGKLTSIPFQIDFDRIHFLVGGGDQSVSVSLVIGGREVLTAAGSKSETMRRHTWDVSAYQGQSAQIVISDQSNTGWGHINADDFRFERLH